MVLHSRSSKRCLEMIYRNKKYPVKSWRIKLWKVKIIPPHLVTCCYSNIVTYRGYRTRELRFYIVLYLYSRTCTRVRGALFCISWTWATSVISCTEGNISNFCNSAQNVKISHLVTCKYPAVHIEICFFRYKRLGVNFLNFKNFRMKRRNPVVKLLNLINLIF